MLRILQSTLITDLLFEIPLKSRKARLVRRFPKR